MLGLLIGLALGANAGALLFDAGDMGWLVMSRAGEVISLVPTIAGKSARDAAISPDMKTWAFISDEKLYVWQTGWADAREIPRAGDVLETPTFSSDGKWIYFIQNDFSTMRRVDEPMRYSQIWRVSSLGGKPQKLSSSAGCHMWPSPRPNGGALFTHATCRGGRGIDLLAAESQKEEQLLGPDAEHGETAIDTTGARTVFIRDYRGEQTLLELDLRTKRETLWAHLPWRAPRLRPGWSLDSKTVWIQNQTAVWRVTADGATTEHLKFSSLRGTP